MYYVMLLGKFGNCYSIHIVWACRQGQWKAKKFSLYISEEATKQFFYVFSDVIFYILAYYKSFRYRKPSQHQHVLLLL